MRQTDTLKTFDTAFKNNQIIVLNRNKFGHSQVRYRRQPRNQSQNSNKTTIKHGFTKNNWEINRYRYYKTIRSPQSS